MRTPSLESRRIYGEHERTGGPDAKSARNSTEETVTHSAIARCLLCLLCGAQGAGTAAIDLNRTHATHLEWVAHARFHLVWQVVSYVLLSLLELSLLLTPGPFLEQRFYLAAVLASVPMLSCFAAFACQRIYGGAIFNPNGIRPLGITAFGSNLPVDLSLASEVAALFLLICIVALFRN
jgi:hypothetical protein